MPVEAISKSVLQVVDDSQQGWVLSIREGPSVEVQGNVFLLC